MTYSVADICKRYGVSEHTVYGWIKSGELAAISVGRKLGGKPKWRITAEALQTFELLRTPTPPTPRERRRKQPADIVEFYK
jgi:excisionase family DNA binding protein